MIEKEPISALFHLDGGEKLSVKSKKNQQQKLY